MSIFCCFSDPVDFEAEVNLFQFELHRAVGKGAFGKVRVVEHKRSKQLYALKYIEKAKCIKQKAVANIIQERRLLEEVDHPFVVNLRYAFQDDENCFFVLDLMLGGDLRFHLERRGHIPEEVVLFWMAELSSALDYLHKQHIIHRDLKPDNILLDSEGHAHITDFNVAIHYSPTRQHSSIAGSMAYMAPEVCLRRGYSWQADWWSLGVCAWELMLGKRPFEGRSAEHLRHAIGKDAVKVPEKARQMISQDATDALYSFLDRNTKKRLGCRMDLESLEDIKTHPWFANIKWDDIENKEAQPPFVPDMKKANFDISHELDEFLMVEKPLTAQKRKVNIDYEKLRPEFKEMEEQFTTFDFTRPRRISYYPHNQPLMVSVPRETVEGHSHSPGGAESCEDGEVDCGGEGGRSHTNTMVAGVTTIGDRSRAGTPAPGEYYPNAYSHPHRPGAVMHIPPTMMMPMGEENEMRSSGSGSGHGHPSGPMRHSGSREREQRAMYLAGAPSSSSAMEMRGTSMDVHMPQRPESALRRETPVH